MLYVFHVDTGTMMTFDMNLAMERVSVLQGVIARGCRITEDKQVLLISGGESLDPSAVVGKYHAGTDTNPIFLFSKSTIESSVPPSPSVNYGSDVDLQGQVEGSLLMPPAYETVVSRAQLALQFQDVDSEEMRACERLIHDQHLQQQGWAAVVANLEDVTSELKQRSDTFHEQYSQYLECRQSYRDLIASVSESLQLLSKIPVLSTLVESHDGANTGSCSSADSLTHATLFDWISSQDTNHTLHDMVEQCDKATEQLDSKVDESFRADVDTMLKEVQNDSMKEVKGLEDRLYGLDQIISGAKKIVQEQADLAQGFVQNQNRLSNIRDRSILPDLCSSHRNQLIEMTKNHSKLREIKKKCRMAKEELSVNLHTRLRWVMYVEKMICDMDGKLTIYLGNLRRLRKRLDILQQVQDAPKVYAQLVIEVVRRRQFSNKFLTWASSLAEDSGRLHVEEVKRREAFIRQIGHHFLQSMFHGFDDYPPAFATERPAMFDQSLPEITVDDIKKLKDSVPELSTVLSEPVEDDWQKLQLLQGTALDLLGCEGAKSGASEVTLAAPSLLDMGEDTGGPYSVEGGSVSLGDQFTECEKEEDIVRKPDFVSMSPPDKEFLLPKSLSEELTQEMRDLKQRPEDCVDAVPLKSDPVVSQPSNSSSSSGTSAIPSSGKQKSSSTRRPGTDMSPEMDTSQEFTTADFYIDESMPSSIESPPKPCSESHGKATLEQHLMAEKHLNMKLQHELKECTLKLKHTEEKLKTWKSLMSDNIPALQNTAKQLKSEQTEYVSKFLEEFDTVRKSLLEYIKALEISLAASNETVIEKLQQEKTDNDKNWTEKITEKEDKIKELEMRMTEVASELEDCKHSIATLNTEKEDLGAKYATGIGEITLKHELELEVEVDKAKGELKERISALEQEIDSKNSVICDKDSAIKDFELRKVKFEEEMLAKFQLEKETICDILGSEYDEKLQKAVKEEQEKAEAMRQSVVTELTEKHEKEKQERLEELKQSLLVEKEQAVEMAQSMLMSQHSKTTDEITESMTKEKSDEFEKIKRELETSFQEQLAKFSSEFNKEKEHLELELSRMKSKEFESTEIQTDVSTFDYAVDETQTDIVSNTNTQVQTEIPLNHSSSMQTEVNSSQTCSMQTDSISVLSSPTQTEQKSFVEECAQTELDNTDITNTSTPRDGDSLIQESMQQDADDNGNIPSPRSPDDRLAQKEILLAEYQQKLDKLEEQHNAEISRLIEQLEKEKEDAQQLKSSLTSMTGDKQTRFNEAVNRVCKEKDRVIEEQRNKERDLTQELDKLKEDISRLLEEKTKAEDIKERALSLVKDKERDHAALQRQLESELGLVRQQVKQYQEQLHMASPRAGAKVGSPDALAGQEVSDVSPSVVQISDPEEPSLHQRIKDLEDVVRVKEEEISKMQQKVMELSMTASTRSLVQDKVSITSCHMGDLVLLCLDERLDQYVVFTVGSTLHFLHTECLPVLGLKTDSGEPKKQWLIAEVIDKEYCQAKKPNNRFKVPVGTKFYRVKARRWTRESNQSPVKKSDTASATS